MNIIFAPFFTKDIDFSQHDSSEGKCKKDNFDVISKYYNSVSKYNLNCVIFHNECSESFVNKYQTNLIKFVYYDKIHRPSYNDERFYCYLDFINRNPNITNIICTDIFDVEFFGDPFQIFDDKYHLYLGSENGKRSMKWIQQKFKQCNLPLLKSFDILYNAGIIGGKVEYIKTLFNNIILQFVKIDKSINANTPTYLTCVDSLKKEENWNIFTGFPLHNKFKSNRNDEKALIKHK